MRLDDDTFMMPKTLNALLRSAGAAVYAVDLVMQKETRIAFCSVRPPGHHAERGQAMGFCYFNNVAVGAAHALEEYGLERVAILDFDVHHGNGTEDILEMTQSVLCSSFQYPFYPYSGYITGCDHIAIYLCHLELMATPSGRRWRRSGCRPWMLSSRSWL